MTKTITDEAVSRMQARLYDARYAVKSRGERVAQLSESIESACQRVRQGVREGGRLNELGELQSRGAGIDVAICDLVRAQEHYETLRSLADALGIEEV